MYFWRCNLIYVNRRETSLPKSSLRLDELTGLLQIQFLSSPNLKLGLSLAITSEFKKSILWMNGGKNEWTEEQMDERVSEFREFILCF